VGTFSPQNIDSLSDRLAKKPILGKVSKITSLESDPTNQHTVVINLASHLSATRKNPLGPATRPCSVKEIPQFACSMKKIPHVACSSIALTSYSPMQQHCIDQLLAYAAALHASRTLRALSWIHSCHQPGIPYVCHTVEPAWTSYSPMHCPCSNIVCVKTRPREMQQNKNSVHLPHIKVASLEVNSTYQYTAVIKLASHMSATQKNSLGPAHASPMQQCHSQTTWNASKQKHCSSSSYKCSNSHQPTSSRN